MLETIKAIKLCGMIAARVEDKMAETTGFEPVKGF